MSGDESFQALHDNVTARLVETVRTASKLANEDLAFVRSTDPSLAKSIDAQSAKLLNLVRRLTASATSSTDVPTPSLPNVDSIEDNWSGIVDVVDSLLEKSDACLDEYTGVIKRLSPSQQTNPTATVPGRTTIPGKAYKHSDIPKPQLLFNRHPANTETGPFKPLLRTKPHAIIPLEESLAPISSEIGVQSYKHPYENEIKQSRYPPSMYLKAEPIPYRPFESTTATFVDTPEAVKTMLEELKQAKEIAVDLEHHDTHSYIGIVSLMQVSTRYKDWIVDTLQPWREDLHVLNEVFADPNIVKVLHGAYMDMVWLQRDLGIYVVGLFDTYHASHALGYPKHSLASLLERFVNFQAQKQYQMADWRIRPLPKEMFDYARSDTHFLLYIFDNMRNELIVRSSLTEFEGDLIEVVLEESKKEALQKYERPFYDEKQGTGSTGWYNMLFRTPALFNKEQFSVFKAVHQWRDNLARKEDESLNAIMPKTVVFNIARELPDDLPALLGCSHPISAPVRRRQSELLAVVKRAKAEGNSGPDMKEFLAAHPATVEYEAEKARRFQAYKAQQAQQTAQTSVAQILQKERALQDSQNLRNPQSSFWGSMLAGLKRKRDFGTQATQQSQGLSLAVPLPSLTAEVFDVNTSTQSPTTPAPIEQGARPEHEYTKERKSHENHIFVVKEVAGPRKRKAAQVDAADTQASNEPIPQTPTDAGADVMDIDPVKKTPEELAAEKAERKAARKAQKKADKAKRREEEATTRGGVNGKGGNRNKADDGNDNHDGDGDIEDQPFDYTTAPSVLHAKPAPATGQKNEKAKTTGVNPYAKSMDAPKGMRRVKKEVQGKSMTFKS